MDQQVIQTLITQGGTGGLLLLATWFLSRTLKNQYEARIGALESHVKTCDEDRMELHKQIFETQKDTISNLKSQLATT